MKDKGEGGGVVRKYLSCCLERLFLCLCHSSSKYTLTHFPSAHTTTLILLASSICLPRTFAFCLVLQQIGFTLSKVPSSFLPFLFLDAASKKRSGTDWENPPCTIWSKIAIHRICPFSAFQFLIAQRSWVGETKKSGEGGERKRRSEQKKKKNYHVHFFRPFSFLLHSSTPTEMRKQTINNAYALAHT